jgi:hypothetical protein
MQIDIKQESMNDISTLSFSSEDEFQVKEILNSEDLQILCNRYRMIKNNKASSQS